jgi:hypothetical protein
VNARVGGTAAHTLHATTLTTAEPTKWFTLASWESVQRRSRISLFSGLCGLNERAYFFLRNSLRARRLAA